MSAERLPVIVGVGQLLQRGVPLSESLGPLEMLTQVAQRAADDAGGGAQLLASLDSISLVDATGWHPSSSPSLLADAVGAQPTTRVVTPIGGENGLALLNATARRILAGDSRIAFVGGTHNLKTLRAAMKGGVHLPWPKGGEPAPKWFASAKPGESELEEKHGLSDPTVYYPLFENALRARRGSSPADHLEALGRLFSPFTTVAKHNPHAWFPVERSAQELSTVTADNRMIAYPYPKYLNSVLDTDQAAGLIVMSTEAAEALGIPASRRVHWLGGAYTQERSWFVSQRQQLSRSVALEACAQRAFQSTGLGIDDIDMVDFYSCFPVAVELACEAYGIAEDDPRGLTVTGGLPYAGGPASNYTTHAVATMVERLRDGRGSIGLATGNGWYLTKHSATLLGTEPPDNLTDATPIASPAIGEPAMPIALEPSGPGEVETYTVIYDRQGAPQRGIVLGRLDSGERFVANTPSDRALLESMVASEFCGQRGTLSCHDGLGRFET